MATKIFKVQVFPAGDMKYVEAEEGSTYAEVIAKAGFDTSYQASVDSDMVEMDEQAQAGAEIILTKKVKGGR